MVNDPELIEKVIKELERIPDDALLKAIAEVDEQYNIEEINLTESSYRIDNNYIIPKELKDYSSIVHIKSKKSFFDLFRKNTNKEKFVEAA